MSLTHGFSSMSFKSFEVVLCVHCGEYTVDGLLFQHVALTICIVTPLLVAILPTAEKSLAASQLPPSMCCESACVCVFMCVHAAGHNPSAFGYALGPLCIPTSHWHTHKHTLSEIMFVPCSADLFWVSSCRGSLTCEHGKNHTT